MLAISTPPRWSAIGKRSQQWLSARTGVQAVGVAYKTSAASLAEMYSGQLDFQFIDATFATQQIRGGKLRAVAGIIEEADAFGFGKFVGKCLNCAGHLVSPGVQLQIHAEPGLLQFSCDRLGIVDRIFQGRIVITRVADDQRDARQACQF